MSGHRPAEIVNGAGRLTRLGGGPLPERVIEAMAAAARGTAPILAWQAAFDRTVAPRCGVEAAICTAGAAAGLTLGAAALLAGLDLKRIERLPATRTMPNKILIHRGHRSGYDHAVRAAGARLVEVGFDEPGAGAGVRGLEPAEFETALDDDVIGALFVLRPGELGALAEVCRRMHRHGRRVLVDAAAHAAPWANLRDVPATGADLVCFSGGKQLQGPQNSGLLVGRRALVASALLQMIDLDETPESFRPPWEELRPDRLAHLPRHGIGRGMKVSKETIAGLLAAIGRVVSGEHQAEQAAHREAAEGVAERLRSEGRAVRVEIPYDDAAPRLVVECTTAAEAERVARAMREGDPSVESVPGAPAGGRVVVDAIGLRLGDWAAVEAALRQAERTAD